MVSVPKRVFYRGPAVQEDMTVKSKGVNIRCSKMHRKMRLPESTSEPPAQ